MWDAFTIIANNVGVSFDKLIILVWFLGGIIFSAKDFKYSLLYWFLGAGALFVAYFEWAENDPSINYVLPLIIFFMAFALMALSLYASSKNAQSGGII